MGKIAKALGLAETATEDEIAAALAELQKKNADLAKQVEEMAAKQTESEADQFCEANKKKCMNRATMKELYLKDRQMAEKVVASIPDVQEDPKALNRAGAHAPSFAGAGEGKQKKDFSKMSPQEAVEAISKGV